MKTKGLTLAAAILALWGPRHVAAQVYDAAPTLRLAYLDGPPTITPPPAGTGEEVAQPVPDTNLYGGGPAPSGPSDMACNSCGDGTCDDGGCGPNFFGCCSSGWYAGAEALFYKSYFTSPYSDFTESSGTGNEFSYNMAPAARLWVGYQNCCCWGIAASYWYFNASAYSPHENEFFIDPALTAAQFNQSFRMYTFDLVGTKAWYTGPWYFMASMGVRNAGVGMNYNGYATNFQDALGAEVITNQTGRRFDGTGLVFGLNGVRLITNSGWGWYWNVKQSVVWGNSKVSYMNSIATIDTGGAVITGQDAISSRDADTAYISELGTGLQWTLPLRRGGYVFARSGIEWQYWHLSGSGIYDSATQTTFRSNGDAFGNGDLSLLGVAFSVGLMR